MSHASSTPSSRARPMSQRSGLPLVCCPSCNSEQVIELIAKTSSNFGKQFFKCPRNQPEKKECNFFMWQEQYEELVGAWREGGGSSAYLSSVKEVLQGVKADIVAELKYKLAQLLLLVSLNVCLLVLVVVVILVK